MDLRERVEGGRRARAALAYSGKKAKDIAKAVNVSPATLGRILDGTRRLTSREELEAIAVACSLSPNWCNADFSRLGEIVPKGRPVFAPDPTLLAAMERELDEVVQRVQQRESAGGSSKPARRRKDRGS